MNHVEGIKNSIVVDNHLCLDLPIQNKLGKFWSKYANYVIGAKDSRARVGPDSTPWMAKNDPCYPMADLCYRDCRLKDLLDARATELFKLSQTSGKKIAVLWSGGIDSTTVLVSFLKNLSRADLDNIEIVMSSSSVIENFDFYRDHISGKIRCIQLLDFDISDSTLDQYMVLHGDPGDAIFGPSVSAFRHLIDGDRHLLPWKNHLDLITEFFDQNQSVNAVPGFGSWYVEFITENLRAVAPDNVRTIADWWWWNYMNFKWTTSILRPFIHMRHDFKNPIQRRHHNDFARYTYFNTDEFVQWSYSNLENHFREVSRDRGAVKLDAKQYIFDFDQNQKYRDRKVKVPSKSYDFEKRISWIPPLYYDQNWVGHYTWEPGVTESAIELLESFRG